MVNADPRRVRQVLDNILDNAMKYSDNGATITVRADESGPDMVISVSDEGIGIPENLKERVFERMYRIEEKGTTRFRGAGLGLAICKGIIEAHGGRIWVVSEEGRGSVFSFSIPL